MNKIPATKVNHIKKQNFDVKVKVVMMSDSLSSFSEKKRNKLDLSGKIAEKIIHDKNYLFLGISYLPDELDKIQNEITKNIAEKLSLIVFIGGTGIAKRDITIEAIKPLLTKELPGFGELFRYKTFSELGTISIMTRTLAGIIEDTIIVCLPGSPNAVQLGMELITQEILHLLNHIT